MKQREKHMQRHKGVIRLQNVSSELGILMTDVARKIIWDQITKNPVGYAEESALYPVGNRKLVKVFKVKLQ